jgi:hypothetical protein
MHLGLMHSGHSKVLHQGGIGLCCVGTAPLKGESYQVDKKPTHRNTSMETFPGQWLGVACFCGLSPVWRGNRPGEHVRALWWKGCRPRARPQGSQKVPSGQAVRRVLKRPLLKLG